MKLLVATVWAYSGRPVENSPLWQSCRRLGVPLFVSQQGFPFHSTYRNKIPQFMADVQREEWDLILFADGDDTFLTRDPWEVTTIRFPHGAAFVVSAEFL